MAFKDELKKYVELGLTKGKKAAAQAKDTVKDLGEQGVLQVEIKQLEHDIKEIYKKIGMSVYEKACNGDIASIEITGSDIDVLVKQITELKEQISERVEKIKQVKNRS